MIGMGTIVNIAAILAGTTVGMLIKGGLPQRFEKTVMSAIGLATFFIGITGALSGMITVNSDGSLTTDAYDADDSKPGGGGCDRRMD